MKTHIQKLLVALVFLPTLVLQPAAARAQGTAFTYQGRLNSGTNVASGKYDLAFSLFSTNSGGVAIAGPVTNSAVAVTNGLFTTTVDFGNAFTGASNWLQIAVSTNGANTFFPLTPRQQLTPVPYAITAENVSGLSIQNNSDGAPNVIGGSSVNFISPGVEGATIGGGGAVNFFGVVAYTNSVTANFGTVSGGTANTASGDDATVGGGTANTASGNDATVGGGINNFASGNPSTVSGGYFNRATGNYGMIPGGYDNIAGGQFSFAAGQEAQALNDGSFVWADSQNGVFASTNNDSFNVRAQGGARFVTGGAGMTIDGNNVLTTGSSLPGVTIQQNSSGAPNVILGSPVNSVSSGVVGATISGGGATNYTGYERLNTVTEDFGTVSGGGNNTASGYFATVPGGNGNTASGADSFAAGYDAHATNDGSFVWSDFQPGVPFYSITNNSFNVRAQGGVRFVTSGAGMTVDGAVGIGTATPDKPLDVAGAAAGVTNGSGSVESSLFLKVKNTQTGGNESSPNVAGIAFGRAGQTLQAIVGGTYGNDFIDFYTSAQLTNAKVRIDSAGNVGIGTTTPANKLDVQGSGDFTGNVGIGTATPANKLDVQGSGDFTGNVGIGTATPANKLDVQGSGDFTGNVGIGTATPNSDSRLQVKGMVRMGSETGTSEAPNKSILVRRINSTSDATNQVVAISADFENTMTLVRDGTPGGLIIKVNATPYASQCAGFGINSSGTTVNFYAELSGNNISNQIFTDAQKIGYVRISFGDAANAADFTTVEMMRLVDNGANNQVAWVGTVTSTVNQ